MKIPLHIKKSQPNINNIRFNYDFNSNNHLNFDRNYQNRRNIFQNSFRNFNRINRNNRNDNNHYMYNQPFIPPPAPCVKINNYIFNIYTSQNEDSKNRYQQKNENIFFDYKSPFEIKNNKFSSLNSYKDNSIENNYRWKSHDFNRNSERIECNRYNESYNMRDEVEDEDEEEENLCNEKNNDSIERSFEEEDSGELEFIDEKEEYEEYKNEKKDDIEPVNISIHFDKPDDSIEIDFDAITDSTERANKMFQHSLHKYPNPKKNIKKSGPITKLFFELKNEKLCDKIRKIYACNNELVGQRIVNINNNPKRYDWIKVYHGTKYEYLKSIFKNGLKKPGETYYDNKKIKIRKGHIEFGKTFYKIKNWAKAIFVSPSIFYSCCKYYSERIKSNREKWCVIIEARVRPFSYTTCGSTISTYEFVKDEPKEVEFRIENKEDIIVQSILFAKEKYITTQKEYKDGYIFN